MNFTQLRMLVKAARFRDRLDDIKASLKDDDIPWYPYDSIGNLWVLPKFLTGDRRDLLKLLGNGPVLDLCCGDGDLSFLLESFGCEVDAVDWPVTNMNFMRGIHRMRQHLNSKVQVHELDLDSRFRLPRQFYSAAIFFGGLYHLKNPFYALEELANHARYCLLSTRVAKYMPDQKTLVQGFPVAYLVGPEELNGDWSNYWIFSESGLRRIVERANWEVCDFTTFGNETNSDPVRPDGDERAFCLLRSKVLAGSQAVALNDGWHQLEEGAWRWTAQRFGLHVTDSPTGGNKLMLRFVLLEALAPVTLTAIVNGERLASQTFRQPGECLYATSLPQHESNLDVQFELDRALAPEDSDPRERGIIIRTGDLLTLVHR